MKTYEKFKEAVRIRESSGNYGCRNQYGYLGAYQFGRARLCDLGLCKRKEGTTGFANDDFEFRAPFSEEKFLENFDLQDDTFDRHVQDLRRRILTDVTFIENLSGAIAASHLVGLGAYLEFARHGKISHDANGTSVSDYFNEFRGYEIPEKRLG